MLSLSCRVVTHPHVTLYGDTSNVITKLHQAITTGKTDIVLSCLHEIAKVLPKKPFLMRPFVHGTAHLLAMDAHLSDAALFFSMSIKHAAPDDPLKSQAEKGLLLVTERIGTKKEKAATARLASTILPADHPLQKQLGTVQRESLRLIPKNSRLSLVQ